MEGGLLERMEEGLRKRPSGWMKCRFRSFRGSFFQKIMGPRASARGCFLFSEWSFFGGVGCLVVEGEICEFFGGGGDGAFDGETFGGGASPEAMAAGVVEHVLGVWWIFHSCSVGY